MVGDEQFDIPVKPGKLSKTISIGLSMVSSGDTSHALIERADKALYHVKNTGRNKVVVFGAKPPKKNVEG